MSLVTKASLTIAGCAALALCVMAPSAASAKTRKMKSCAKAEARFLETGEGDRDGDGLSDCREVKQLGTSPTNPDTDSDGVSDTQEVSDHTDPLDSDSDDDGMDDSDDPAPRIQQRLKVFVDALTCPTTGVPGTLSALGMSVTLDDTTVFEDESCDALAALIAAQPDGTQVFAEVDVVEGSTGIVTATKVASSQEEQD